MTCIGLEPEGFSLAHVVRGENERPQLQACDYRQVGPGANIEREIAMALRDYQLTGSTGIAVLGHHSYSLRMVDAPDVGTEFMKEAVRYSIADLIDFDIDEAVLDLFTLPDQDGTLPIGSRTPGREGSKDAASEDSALTAPASSSLMRLSNIALTRFLASLTVWPTCPRWSAG